MLESVQRKILFIEWKKKSRITIKDSLISFFQLPPEISRNPMFKSRNFERECAFIRHLSFYYFFKMTCWSTSISLVIILTKHSANSTSAYIGPIILSELIMWLTEDWIIFKRFLMNFESGIYCFWLCFHVITQSISTETCY